MLYYEKKLGKEGFDFIVGIDEAGRGPLAGPVVAAAVFLKKRKFSCRIDDCKQLSPIQRQEAYMQIIANSFYSVGVVNNRIIDHSGISQATSLAMQKAARGVVSQMLIFQKGNLHILVDGNSSIDIGYPSTAIIRGDEKSLSIASASIIAKVVRDTIMEFYDRLFPQYHFSCHKGYPTREHIQALKKFGPCPIHRLSFKYE